MLTQREINKWMICKRSAFVETCSVFAFLDKTIVDWVKYVFVAEKGETNYKMKLLFIREIKGGAE